MTTTDTSDSDAAGRFDGRHLRLSGLTTPVPDEIDAVDLPVEGALPPELVGRYLRNGPNPPPGVGGSWIADAAPDRRDPAVS